MTITAKDAAKDKEITGKLEVNEDQQAYISYNLEEGQVRVLIYEEGNPEGEVFLDETIDGGGSFSQYNQLLTGRFDVVVTALEKTTGTIDIEVQDVEYFEPEYEYEIYETLEELISGSGCEFEIPETIDKQVPYMFFYISTYEMLQSTYAEVVDGVGNIGSYVRKYPSEYHEVIQENIPNTYYELDYEEVDGIKVGKYDGLYCYAEWTNEDYTYCIWLDPSVENVSDLTTYVSQTK